MSAAVVRPDVVNWPDLEDRTDNELLSMIVAAQNILAERKRQAQEAAKKRALSILKEAGLDSVRLVSKPKKGEK
jgi:hypothetical protein